MTDNKSTQYRPGMLAEYWADYEKKVIDEATPAFQRREAKQAYIAGVVAHMAAEAAATETAKDADQYIVFSDEIANEAVAMGVALMNEEAETQCDCPGCKAERGEDADVKVRVYARGLNDEQSAQLAQIIADFVAEHDGGAKPRTLN